MGSNPPRRGPSNDRDSLGSRPEPLLNRSIESPPSPPVESCLRRHFWLGVRHHRIPKYPIPQLRGYVCHGLRETGYHRDQVLYSEVNSTGKFGRLTCSASSTTMSHLLATAVCIIFCVVQTNLLPPLAAHDQDGTPTRFFPACFGP